MNTPILHVKKYSKYFNLHEQNKIIPSSHDISFQVFSGQLTALTGPTGAGKSSILKGIYRTYLPSAGEIMYCNQQGQRIDLARAEEHQILALRRNEIGFVTQFLHCLPRQSTLDIVSAPLIKMGAARQEAQQLASELLSAMNLPERLWTLSPSTFSGGERQRVNLARGLISKPRLLLLDEPTASLDPLTAAKVTGLIQNLKSQGTAMLAIFHDPAITQQLADHIVELTPPPALTQFLKDIA
ncbi:phosphonate C-P lyase system protein PhnL [Acinetobacter sp. ANC 3813]|uniref:phosphonate C-P lyase system protein PhnL n=1 Tax=Acinetobacter sp. ANC 3813 TaxID=1977873 RepID=UPI000A35AA39|nr:phosphonate C-P lyase system protein PhnL [Acinetobacter sp. ANC 3813]OTG88532.1 phosphonate C-P lyase system protein PhnL [Acinetobacter sp. ANC 3813]